MENFSLSPDQLKGIFSLMASGKLQSLLDSTSTEKENEANEANKAEGSGRKGSACGRSTSEEAEGEKKDGTDDIVLLESTNNEAVNFTARELLEKAKRGVKATSAQQTFRYVLRQAASRCGLWDNPPLMAKIGGKVMERFLNQVTRTLPQLCGRSRDIRNRLAESLRYKRNQLNNTKYWKRATKLKKYKSIAIKRPPKTSSPQKKQETTTDVVETQLKSHEVDDDEDDGFQFTAGEELFVMSGAERLSRVTFVRQSTINDEYAKLVMQTNYDTQSENRKIKLAGPNMLEFLHEVKIGEKFYWPMNQLLKKSDKSTVSNDNTKKTKAKKNAAPAKKKNKAESPHKDQHEDQEMADQTLPTELPTADDDQALVNQGQLLQRSQKDKSTNEKPKKSKAKTTSASTKKNNKANKTQKDLHQETTDQTDDPAEDVRADDNNEPELATVIETGLNKKKADCSRWKGYALISSEELKKMQQPDEQPLPPKRRRALKKDVIYSFD